MTRTIKRPSGSSGEQIVVFSEGNQLVLIQLPDMLPGEPLSKPADEKAKTEKSESRTAEVRKFAADDFAAPNNVRVRFVELAGFAG